MSSGSRYKLLGFVVWRTARWYARRRLLRWLPSRRRVIAGVAGVVGLGGAAVVARRALA